jgi:DNA-binding beta-propeller fold protein YncE
MNLLNLRGELITSIQAESGNWPWDIAVTRDGGLVYTDPGNKTINLVKDKQIQAIITLREWCPLFICHTLSDDLMVIMRDNDRTESKVVRYSGSIEKQNIQFDDQGPPLYSSNFDLKYTSENKNLDIYVADHYANAIVVVNQSGKLRFRYTGHPSDTKYVFGPIGITTDSQSHILTADSNHRIHILDKDRQFLHYIQNCDLHRPWGLCVDTKDNLFVADNPWISLKSVFENFSVLSDFLGFLSVQIMKCIMIFTSPRKF